jgi:bifunctional DNA-binding transcriptional regulator/antitoxin component of YhaV-PrlF toxin-antitoxin module
MSFIQGRVSVSGRLSLPAEFRKAVGLERGGEVVVELAGNEIRIRTVRQAAAHAQAIARRMMASAPKAGVDDFLDTRRHDEADME